MKAFRIIFFPLMCIAFSTQSMHLARRIKLGASPLLAHSLCRSTVVRPRIVAETILHSRGVRNRNGEQSRRFSNAIGNGQQVYTLISNNDMTTIQRMVHQNKHLLHEKMYGNTQLQNAIFWHSAGFADDQIAEFFIKSGADIAVK